MRRAQTITLDLLFAIFMIVTSVVVLFIVFGAPEQPEDVSRDALLLSQAIFEPYPADWNATDVVRPGFVTGHRFSPDLFAEFAAMDPDQVRRLTGTSAFYYIEIAYVNGTSFNQTGEPPVDAEALHNVRRAAIMNGTFLIVEVRSWV